MANRPSSLPLLLKRVLGDPPAQASDRELLECFVASGNQAAFATLLDRHGPVLLGLCRRQLSDAHLAEDVLQATFLVLARKARTIRRRDNVGGWLYGVAQRLVRQARLSEAARSRRQRVAAAAAKPIPSTDPAWDELLLILDEEMQGLPDRYRGPLLLCYLEGRTQDEAAKQLNWSLSTLRRRLESGRELLRARMVRRGATLGAGLVASVVAPSAVRAALTAELRQAVLTVAASAGAAAAVSPSILVLAHGELRMALFSKWLLGSALLMTAATVLAALAWWSGQATQAVEPQPPRSSAPAAIQEEQQVKSPVAGRDLFNDPLPKGALARLGTVEFRHGPYGQALKFAADGKHLISLGGGWIRRWDLATGQADLNIGKDWPVGQIVSSEMMSVDGKLACICRYVNIPNGVDFFCTEYDLESGKERRTYNLDLGGVQTRLFIPKLISPDGKLLAGLAREVRIWRTSDGSLAHHLIPPEGRYTTMAFAPDGMTLFVGDDVHTIHVFDLASGKEQRSFGIANVKGVVGLALSPDGKRLASVGGDDSFVRLWNVDKGTEERTLDFPEEGWAHSLSFTPDGRTVLVGISSERSFSRRAVRSWDAVSGKPGRAWIADPSLGLDVAVSADGKALATMNGAGVIRFWDMETGQERRPLAATPGALQTVCFQADAKTLLTVGDDQAIRQWEAGTGRLLGAPRPLVQSAAAQFVQGGKLLLSYSDKNLVERLRLVDPATGHVFFEAIGQEAVLSPDGKRLATSGADMTAQVYDVESGKVLQTWSPPRPADGSPGLRDKVRGFSSDGQSLIVQGEIVTVYSVQTGRPRSSWGLYRNKVLEMSEDSKPKFKQPTSKVKQPTFPLRHLGAVAVSPDGSLIAFGLDCSRAPDLGAGVYVRFGRLMILETATGKLVHQSDLPDGQASFRRLVFSADGKHLAAGGEGTVRVWEVGTQKEARLFEGHRGRVEALAFNPDGTRLASASNDSTVLVWDLAK